MSERTAKESFVPHLGSVLRLQRCPHCYVNTPNLPAVHQFQTAPAGMPPSRHWKVYVCQSCGGAVLAAASVDGGKVVELYPQQEPVHEELPPRAREYLCQAIESGHSPAGAVMLAASAIDAMLKAKGYSDGTLYARIDKAADDHTITKEMAEWAHEVRLDANDQRHADDEAPLPTLLDGFRCIEFARALGEFMFVLPARVKRGRDSATPPGDTSKPIDPARLAGM